MIINEISSKLWRPGITIRKVSKRKDIIGGGGGGGDKKKNSILEAMYFLFKICKVSKKLLS